MIYFDNAATTLVKPQGVINAVNFALKNYSVNPGRSAYKASIQAAEKIYKTRVKIAEFFGAEPENISFTANCTHSINCILKGVLKSGEHIIVSDLEHNAVMRPLFSLSKNRGVKYSISEITNDDEVTLKNFEELINDKTRMIFCTHASNVTGRILPIKRIGDLCKRHGIMFGVDGAQSCGVLPINMKEMNIDFLAIAPHKGLYSPMGIGILIARKPLDFTIIEGGTGTNSVDLSQPTDMPERLESGTVNLPGIFGVNAGIDFLRKREFTKIYKHEFSLSEYIYNSLCEIKNIQLYTPKPELYKSAPVLPFNIKGLSSEETANYLAKHSIATRAGLHCAPSAHKKIGTLEKGCVRISVSLFNNFKEVDFLIKILKKI